MTITLYGLTFQTNSTSSIRTVIGRACNTTSPSCYQKGFSLNFTGFTRRYLRHLVWFLFLPLLRCFSSGRSRSWLINTDVFGCPIRKSSVQRLHAPRRGLSQLGTSFIGSWAQPFTGWYNCQFPLHFISVSVQVAIRLYTVSFSMILGMIRSQPFLKAITTLSAFDC